MKAIRKDRFDTEGRERNEGNVKDPDADAAQVLSETVWPQASSGAEEQAHEEKERGDDLALHPGRRGERAFVLL